MFIYKLESEYSISNSNHEYLVHDKQFTKEEFIDICKKGLRNIINKDVKDAYELKENLILNYGFKPLPINCKFEFKED